MGEAKCVNISHPVTSKVTHSGQWVFRSINIKIASLAQIKGIVIEHQHKSILFTPYVFF